MAAKSNGGGYVKVAGVLFVILAAVVSAAMAYGQVVQRVSDNRNDIDRLKRCTSRQTVLLERICVKMEISTKVDVD